LDIFSRRVVGWRIEHSESASQFKELFIDAMEKHAVPRDQLTVIRWSSVIGSLTQIRFDRLMIGAAWLSGVV